MTQPDEPEQQPEPDEPQPEPVAVLQATIYAEAEVIPGEPKEE